MANIGSFKKVGSDFQGEIVTLSVQAKGVRIVAETNRSNDNAPSHRVYVGRAEIGAARSKRSEEGRDYLSLKLDDPSFNTPIYANLFDDKDGESYTLIWSRPRKNNADSPANFSMRETWRYSSRSAAPNQSVSTTFPTFCRSAM
jgi:uncharacterized protein (DUF736 family)